MKKFVFFALFLVLAGSTRAQGPSGGLIQALSVVDLHATLGFTANVNKEALLGPAWGLNVLTYDRLSTGVGFTRSGFGPFLGFRVVWVISAQGYWNALYYSQKTTEGRFSAGLFINL